MEKTFCIENPMVGTTDNILTIGETYMYKEGRYVIEVILKGVKNTEEMLYLDLFFHDRNETIEVSMKHGNYGFSGMWRLFDLGELAKYRERQRKWEEEEEDEEQEPDLSAIQTTREQFIAKLTEDQLDKLILHFNTICMCPELGVHEQKMTWLAWLLGEREYIPSPEFEIVSITVGGFNKDDFAITFESEEKGKIDFGFLRTFYRMDEMYEHILKKQQ